MTDCESDDAMVWGDKDPDDVDTFYVDFERACVRIWTKETDFIATTRIREGGFDYESSGGRTGKRRPPMPTTIGATVNDGSLTWTCRALSSSSLYRTITGTPTWTADAGITVASQSISGSIASASLSGGTDSNDYTVLVKATFSDSKTNTATCILPIRRPIRSCEY